MTRDIKLICTDRGQHDDAVLDVLRVEDDGTFDLVPYRMAATPWASVPGARIIVEGEHHEAGKKTIRRVEDHRSDYEGRWRWRRTCDRCLRDIPINKDTMRKIARSPNAVAVGVVDLSWLP